MEACNSIKCSTPLLGGKVKQLQVLYSGNGVLALEKPSGVLIDAYPWYPDAPSMIPVLKQEKADLAEYALDSIYSVYSLEPEITGVALIATNKESSAFLRNELGSGKFLFRFTLLASSELDVDLIECDLPLAKHYNENTVVVSNKTGKKCRTVFNLLKTVGASQLWEAKTDYIRMHQIRVHAMESGIHILGEKLYTESRSPRSLAFKGKMFGKRDTKSFNDGLCLHLSSVEWEQDGEKVVVRSPLPQRMEDFIERGLTK